MSKRVGLMDLVEIELTDPESLEIYQIGVSKANAERAKEDLQFAQTLLNHAKCQYMRNQLEVDDYNETTQESELSQNIDNDGEYNPEMNDEDLCEDNPGKKSLISQNKPNKKCWTFSDTAELISAVESHYDELHHPLKRKHVWENISNDLASKNIAVPSNDCYKKWQNLLRSYKTAKDCNKRTGRGPSRFHFFQQMDEFLGTQPSNSSPHSIDVQLLSQSEEPLLKCSKDNTVEVDGNEKMDSNLPESTKKRKTSLKNDYLKTKKYYFEVEQEQAMNKSREQREKLSLFERKLEIEERKVLALEKLVKLKEQENEKLS